MQFSAYNDAIRHYKNDCEYIAFIDVDEFLVPAKQECNLAELIKKLMRSDPKTSGLSVNCGVFDSSGLVQKLVGVRKFPLVC